MSAYQVSYPRIVLELDLARDDKYKFWAWLDGIGQAVVGRGATPVAAIGNLFENLIKVSQGLA